MAALPTSALPGVAVDYDPFAGEPLLRVVPTTEPQREVWLADQLGREASLAFNESVSLRLRGALNAPALHAAVTALVARRDALRAVFGPDGETLCVLARISRTDPTADADTLGLTRSAPSAGLNVGSATSSPDFSPPRAPDRRLDALAKDRCEKCGLDDGTFAPVPIDLSSLDRTAADAALQAHRRAAVETPFDLLRGPLFRAELLRLAADDHVLLLTAHHIVCDGWSWWLIVRELGTLYAQQLANGEAALTPAASFADYALEQAGAARNETLAADAAYWLSRFADGAPVLELPLDRARPAQRGFASAREDYTLDATLVGALRRLGGRHGASLFAALLAGFASVLARLSGQDDVVIGIPAAGQSVDGHDDVVGHCVNLLPLRCPIDPGQSFGALLDATQNTLLDALDHQRYTYGELLQRLRIGRDPSRLPLVSVMFNIDQALDHESTVFPGLSLEFASNPRSFENFELFINAVQEHGALRLECQYNRELFDAQTVRRWLAAYEQLLRAACEQPDAACTALSWLSAPARAELQALQPPASVFDRHCGMHEHFERQCAQTPQRIAVQAGAEAASYAELEARANRIAHLLRARGVRRGALVGLALDRGIDMLAGLLGILKSGAGYVPLDPGFPAERLAYMAGDAGLAALITHGRYADAFDLRGRPVLALDALAAELAAAPTHAIGRDADSAAPESIAYVIYTSGSTGRPKGVSVPHRAVANFIYAMRIEPGMRADDRLVAVTTLSFDIAVLEWLLPLSMGAQVIIADRDTASDGGALMRLITAQRASVMQATPATWRLLLEAGWQGDPAFTVLCGGEPLPPELAAQLLARCGTLWNLYGPTETTVWSTCAPVRGSRDSGLPDVHIGRPIANTQVWILDHHGTPCPRGVPGEICIGGDGVTLGYLHRPELSAERFIADPFAAIPANVEEPLPAPLLYRTGDRGRWRSDGNLEHLGRLDFQVKVRGYRIELGEIENALLAHPAVANALVMAREDRPGDVRLVAYVVARSGAVPTEAALLEHLRGTLPDYMIPQHLVMLDRLPLLPNGKVDRKALLAPQTGGSGDRVRTAPRDALETTIAAAMAQALGTTGIDVHDDFFALGGHSLLAAQVTSRLNRELGVALSLRSLFDTPTVAKLAQTVRQSGAAGTLAAPVHIPRHGDQRRAPLSMMQERLRLLEAFNPGQLSYNIPSAHRLRGALDLAALDRAFRQLAQRQSVLRTSLGEDAGEPVQVIHDSVEFGLLAVEDLRQLPHEQREQALARRMQAMVEQPFADLESPPLLRARLFRTADQEHVLFFMAHHFIWDGWSFDLLYTEIAELYAAAIEQRLPQLPELPVSYGDYAAWHREFLHGPEYARQLAFWRDRLGRPALDGAMPRALVTDMPRQRGMSGRSDSLTVSVPLDLVERLNQIARGLDATLFVTLLSAYFVALAGFSGERDIVVGTPVRGRNSAEVEDLMGYFTNLLPLRVDVDAAAGFPQLVRTVKDVLLDSFAHPDVLLEDLGRELALHGGSSGVLYHALFSFQDIRQRVVRWGNLQHERVEVFQPGATEDLGLWFVLHEHGLNGGLIFNADIFHAHTVQGLIDRYLQVLESIAANAARPLAQLTDFPAGRARGQGSDGVQAAVPAPAPATAAPQPTDAPARIVSAPPADPRIAYLAAVWSSVLGDIEVGTDDNFFDLGGNSMHAAQMAERVARDTGYRIKLLRLAAQSLAQIASDLPAATQAPLEPAAGNGIAHRLRRLFGRDRTSRQP
ncbi:MAG: amino acid adenylation domain-containing protein [Xanthomonadaceae bacterium]|nr:amino acid adenylation domain-containing protein [Xanthomonadaceae bacterium]